MCVCAHPSAIACIRSLRTYSSTASTHARTWAAAFLLILHFSVRIDHTFRIFASAAHKDRLRKAQRESRGEEMAAGKMFADPRQFAPLSMCVTFTNGKREVSVCCFPLFVRSLLCFGVVRISSASGKTKWLHVVALADNEIRGEMLLWACRAAPFRLCFLICSEPSRESYETSSGDWRPRALPLEMNSVIFLADSRLGPLQTGFPDQ